MIDLVMVIVVCDVIPYVVISMLFPQLARFAPKQTNYRGKQVLSGLGIVWFVWLALVWMGSVVYDFFGAEQPGWMQVVVMAFPLLAGTCAFGLFDDWVGDNKYKGFKGHFRELRRGHLTTGMLKVIGIGLFSLATGIMLYDPYSPLALTRIICATLTIALFANTMNLLDLRPLRASKCYLVCIVLCMFTLLLSGRVSYDWLSAICTLLACVGPVIATWKLDANEVAMLGDAGANTMGALIGFILSITLPIWLLIPVTVALLVVNLLSERYSFSAIIEKVPFLRAFDRAFRPAEAFEDQPREDSEDPDEGPIPHNLDKSD